MTSERAPGDRRKKAIPWDTLPLGQVSDRWLAKLLGVDRAAVIYARKRRGIPPCTPAPQDAKKEEP